MTDTLASIDRQARALAVRMSAALRGAATFEVWAPIVIDTARGVGAAVWQRYDDAGGEAVGWAKYEFHKVRQVRNHPILGRALWAAVNEGR